MSGHRFTAAELDARRSYIGGSDITTLVHGTPEDVHRRVREKRGEIEPEDLSRVLPVQMGVALEPFIAEWFTLTTGREVTNRNEFRRGHLPFQACNIDGMTGGGVWEAKFTLGFSKKDLPAYYTPQVTWNATICGAPTGTLAILSGAGSFDVIDLEIDPFYANELIELAAEFWRCVETAADWPGYTPPAAPTPPGEMKRIAVADQNWAGEWKDAAEIWLANRNGAKAFDGATKSIKSLVPADACEVTGAGLIVSRDKRGVAIKEIAQ